MRPQVSDFPTNYDKGEKQSNWPLEYRGIRNLSQALRIMERRFEYLDRKTLDADTAFRLYAHLAAKVQVNEVTRLDMEKWKGAVN